MEAVFWNTENAAIPRAVAYRQLNDELVIVSPPIIIPFLSPQNNDMHRCDRKTEFVPCCNADYPRIYTLEILKVQRFLGVETHQNLHLAIAGESQDCEAALWVLYHPWDILFDAKRSSGQAGESSYSYQLDACIG